MRRIRSPNVHDDPAPYSQGIVHGETIYLAGQVPDNESGEIVGDDIETQTQQAINNVESILESAGSSLSDVLSVTAYLTSMDDFKRFNAVYSDHFGEPEPARATVAVEGLAVNARIELQVIAAKNSRPIRPAGK